MRKGIIISLVFMFFISLSMLASGCGESTVEPVTAFTADFTAEYRGLKPCGSVSVSGAGYASVTLDSPETVRGVSAVYRGTELSLSLDGLRCTSDEAYLPDGSFFSLMKRALTEVGDPDSRCEYEFDERGYPVSAKLGELRVNFRYSE